MMNTKSHQHASGNGFENGMKIAFCLILIAAIFCYSTRSLFENHAANENAFKNSSSFNGDTLTSSPDKHTWSVKNFYSQDGLLDFLTDSIYNSISDDEKVAQLIMPGTSLKKGIGIPISEILELYKAKQIGGVVFLKGTKVKFTEQIKQLNETAVRDSILPAIISCDCEPALFHKKFTDADSITVTSKLKTREQAIQSSESISRQIIPMGIQWNFAPVADVSYNKAVINNRSFGSDNKTVINQSVAFIEQFAENNIATTLKHFPGHGAVIGDSHHKLVFIDSVMFEVENFKEIIKEAHPESVMIGHIAVVKNAPYNTAGLPSSLSREIVTNLLKESMGFKGVVITDAMNMGAVKNIPDADFKAIIAGNDVILMPLNPVALHKRLLNELKEPSLIQTQIIVSIKKVIRLKICTGVIKV